MSLNSETEADTRANRISPVLAAAGWGVVEGSEIKREVICPGRIQVGGQRQKKKVTVADSGECTDCEESRSHFSFLLCHS